MVSSSPKTVIAVKKKQDVKHKRSDKKRQGKHDQNRMKGMRFKVSPASHKKFRKAQAKSLPGRLYLNMGKMKLVVLTGAGISAESGLKTFRDSDGLWEGYDINEVATATAWRRNPALVLEFYNMRRKNVKDAQPNAAHYALAELEKDFNVHTITQNIDDLHERAGSTKVTHLHGEI